MTGEETLSVEARLIADLGVQVDRLTRQVMFRDMIITELKHEVKMERADAVAHLRERAIHGAGNTITVEDACTILADLFERGEHRKETA